MCVWLVAATSLFESQIAKNILSEDIRVEGRSIPFVIADYLPIEPDLTGGTDYCKLKVAEAYQHFVYALAKYYNCDIKHISGVSIHKLHGQVFDPDQSEKSQSPTSKYTPEERAKCNRAKIGGYCPTYLQYAECVFKNYVIKGNEAAAAKLDQLKDKRRFFHPLFRDYISRSKNVYTPLLDETIFQLCRFVNNACPSLNPQFEDRGGFKLLHICGVFDVYTPLHGYDSLYEHTLTRKERKTLVKEDRKLGETFYLNTTFAGVEFSPLGVPHDVHINSKASIDSYFHEKCRKRCEYFSEVKTLTDGWKKLSNFGYNRQLLLCIHHSVLCPTCPICETMDVSFTST